MIIAIIDSLFLLLSAITVTYLIRHYIFTFAVLKNAQKPRSSTTIGSVTYQPSVSILIPARNEEKVIGRLLQRLTELTYPKDKMQVIVIDDASADKTGRIADEYTKVYSYIEVIHRRKEEGGHGKASALNAGLKHAKNEIILCFDADYYPQKDIIEKLVSVFSDPKVGAVQGRVTVLNEPQNLVTRLVALERIGGYRIDQQARQSLGLIPQFGGTVGGFRHSLLERLGGWDESILAEDTDLTFCAYLLGYNVCYVNDAECYEEAVENWCDYWKQRYRWAKGHMQCFFKHWLSVLRSDKLRVREKIDGLLLLNIYFMPVWVLLSWVIGIPLFFIKCSQGVGAQWTLVPIALYSLGGNFAPFFEVGVGAYLDGRTRAGRLIPLLLFAFLYNTLICTKAFIDLLTSKITRKNTNHWERTNHTGNGDCYLIK